MWPNTRLLDLMGLDIPIIQAPMAGASGPDMAIAACEAGGLGSLPCAMLDPEQAREETGKAQKVSRRVAQLVASSRFWPEGEGPQGAGSAVLLLEALLPSQPLPQDGRKGWFE